MTLPPLGTSASKLSALGLVLVVAAFVGFGVVRPVIVAYASAIEEVRRLGQTFTSHRDAERQAGALSHQLANLKAEGPLSTLAMAPSSDGAAVAHLQSQLAQIVESSGGLMTSVQALPTKPGGSLRRIGLRLQLVADNKSLLAILHALEFGRPITILDNVFIHSQTAKAVGVERSLSVRLDVFAYVPEQT